VTWDSDQDQRYKDLIATLEGIKPYAATPLVQSISAAAKQDFSGFTGASKTLLVLTDGAEDDGQKRGENAQAAFIASKGKALADNMAGENVSLHVVQFALTPGERKEADDLFAPLKTDQPGMVRLWPANDVNNLRQALLDAIRPKLKLADRGDNIPAGFPPTGWASRVPDRREPPYDPAKLYWTPRIADDVMGPFKASAYPARLPSTTSLNLLPGELMILGFGNDRPRIRVRRELYADYILNSWAKARSRNEPWALSLSGRAAVNDAVSPPEYLSLAFLEQVPPHRRGKGQRDADVGPLAFAHPDLTWWQVTPAAGKGEKPPPAGTVRVTRQYGYPAPGWEVKVEGWPLPPFPAAEYRVWAADAADTDRYASFVQCAVRDEPTTLTTKLGDKLEMRAAIESWQPARADAPVECLVVRFTFDKGKPVFARPVDLPASYSEHRYYGANAGADGMIAYTAVFELPVQQLKSSGVRLKLIPVQPSRTDDNLLLLTPPEPRKGTSPDKGSLPRPSDPVK
jgi:hypothetical protein